MSSVARSDDESVPDGSALGQWSKVFVEGGKKFGRSFTIVDDDVQQTCMKVAGFTDITVKDIKVGETQKSTYYKLTDNRTSALSGIGRNIQK